MSTIEWIVWCVLMFFLAGGSLSSISHALERRRERKSEDERRRIEGPSPICGCDHHLAFHDEKSGCQQKVKTTVAWRYDDFEDDPVETAWEMMTCPCVRYTGPQPVDSLYLPSTSSDVRKEMS